MNSTSCAIPHYAFSVERVVTWSTMDAYQHVNNTVYFRYFEDVRIVYFDHLGIMETMQEGIGPILASTQCRFKVPIEYPDTVHIGTRIRDIGGDRFWMDYAVFSQKLGRIAAEGNGLIVCYDYNAKKKAPLPELWTQQLHTGVCLSPT